MPETISESVVGIPAGRLREYVASYVGYRHEGFPAGHHAGLPSRFVTFVVSLGAAVELVAGPGPAPPQPFATLVGGLHDAAVTIRHDGNQHGIQLSVTPLGCRALFGIPAAAIAATVVPLDAVLGRAAGELAERLHAAPTWQARFAVCDDVLGRIASDPPRMHAGAAAAWQMLCASGGAVEVATLADAGGYSRRHLSAGFRAEFGLPPKRMARVMRFERARALVAQPDPAPLAGIAAVCGYADQAHMTREWQALAGSSPQAWRAAEVLPFVQDGDRMDAAGSGS